LGGILFGSEQAQRIHELYGAFCQRWNINSPLHSNEIRTEKGNFSWLGRVASSREKQRPGFPSLCSAVLRRPRGYCPIHFAYVHGAAYFKSGEYGGASPVQVYLPRSREDSRIPDEELGGLAATGARSALWLLARPEPAIQPAGNAAKAFSISPASLMSLSDTPPSV